MIISGNHIAIGLNQQGAGRSIHLNRPPNFGTGGMPTKSTPAMSDEEFKTTIEEMARNDVAAGRTFDKRSAEYHDLFRQYTSVVSPDREAIVKNRMSALEGTLRANLPRINPAVDFFQLLFKNAGPGKLFNSKDIGNTTTQSFHVQT